VATPDVRVRLSAEGAQEIIDLFRRINRESNAAARSAGGAFDGVGQSVGRLTGLLGTLGLSITAAGLVGLVKSSLDAADGVGKFADKIGSTAERVSTLKQVAAENDIEFETLKTSMFAFLRNLDALSSGSAEQTKAFKALGLSAKDFVGKDTVQALDIVAQKLGKMENGTRRSQLAMAVLGKQGAELLPVLQDLAEEGFGAAEQRARELGVLITGDLAAAAAQANDSFDVIKAQATGLANAFVSGLAPSIVAVMGDFSKSIGNDGVKSMQQFGRETGRILRTVIEVFRGFWSVVTEIVGGIGDQIGGLFAAGEAAIEGRFRDARSILSDMGKEIERRFRNIQLAVSDAIGATVNAARTEAPALKPAAKKDDRDKSPPPDTSTADAAARRKAEKEATDRQKLFDDQRKLQEAASEISAQTSREIIAQAGQERAAKIEALDAEIRKRQLILALAGQLGDREKGQLDRFRTLSVARINFEDLKQQGDDALGSLDRERTRIQQSVQLGYISQLQGENQLIAIERERLVVLRQLSDGLRKAAEASGDPQLMAQAEQFAASVRNVEVELRQATDTWLQIQQGAAEALGSGFTDFFADVITGTQKVTDAFQSMANNVIRELARIAAQQLAMKFLGFLSDIPGLSFLAGAVKKADGGLIYGSGSDRSDNIPAWLSPGEFVVRAAAVRQIGVDVLAAINRGVRLPRAGASSFGRFADGGLVRGFRPGAGATTDQGMTVAPTYNISGLGLSFEQVQLLMKRNNEDLVRSLLDRRSRR